MIPIGDTEKISRPPLMNILIVLLSVSAFVYIFFFSHHPENLISKYGFIPSYFWGTDWNPIYHWTKYIPLISAQFIHVGYLHILGNLLFLLVFGDNVEDKLGHWRYLLFYLICGIIAFLVHGYVLKKSSLVVVGASGAISGIMGAFYILFPRARIKSFFIFFTKEIPAIYFLLVWFLFNLGRGLLYFEGKFIEPVAWWAHIGGFIAGALLVNLFVSGSPSPKASSRRKSK